MKSLEPATNKLDRALATQALALQLRAKRQELLASNVVNADTPGYRALDFDFGRALEAALGSSDAARLSPPSLGKPASALAPSGIDVLERAATQPSVDGNTVDMDQERQHFADNALRYEFALRALNGQIKTLLSAIQG